MEESPMKKTGHKQSLMLATLGAVMLLLSVPPGTLAQEAKGKFGGKQIFAKTVLGKEYRMETAEGEAGKYWVYWGDEKMKWEPKPFYPDELNQKGPMFYAEHLNLKFFPYNSSLQSGKSLPPLTCKTVLPSSLPS